MTTHGAPQEYTQVSLAYPSKWRLSGGPICGTACKSRPRTGQGLKDSISRSTCILGLHLVGLGLRRLDLGESTAPTTRTRGARDSEDSISARSRLRRLDLMQAEATVRGRRPSLFSVPFAGTNIGAEN